VDRQGVELLLGGVAAAGVKVADRDDRRVRAVACLGPGEDVLHCCDLAHRRPGPRVDVEHHEGPFGPDHPELLQERLPLEVLDGRVVVEHALPHGLEAVPAVVVGVLLLRLAVVRLPARSLGERQRVLGSVGVAGLEQGRRRPAADVLDLLYRDQVVAADDRRESDHDLRLGRLRRTEDLDVDGRQPDLDRSWLRHHDRGRFRASLGRRDRGRGPRRGGRAAEEQEQP